MAMSTERPIEAEARLRAKHQVTVPEPIVRALDAQVDDTLLFETDPQAPRVVHLRVVPRTFAGSLRGLYGTTDQVLALLREEHAAGGE
jgi:bifunctional DNA-binding transcriptional regulator/antitoxin component of YhaV-PrlF toxin-antitoxin module